MGTWKNRKKMHICVRIRELDVCRRKKWHRHMLMDGAVWCEKSKGKKRCTVPIIVTFLWFFSLKETEKQNTTAAMFIQTCSNVATRNPQSLRHLRPSPPSPSPWKSRYPETGSNFSQVVGKMAAFSWGVKVFEQAGATAKSSRVVSQRCWVTAVI